MNHSLKMLLDNKPSLYRYPQLPQQFKSAIDQYCIIDGFCDVNQKLYLCSFVHLSEICEEVAASPEIFNNYPRDFNKYHKDYVSYGLEDHGKSVWGIILDVSELEVIEDGWHRFHEYCEKYSGDRLIPCMGILDVGYVSKFAELIHTLDSNSTNIF